MRRLLVALALSTGCSPQPERETVPILDQRELASWDYRLPVPPDFVRQHVQPIDSKVEQWKGPGVTLGTDFGMYTGRATCSGNPRCRQWQETIAGRPAEITRDAWARPDGPAATLNIYLPVVERSGRVDLALGIIASCSDERACDRALRIARGVQVVRVKLPESASPADVAS